MVQRSTNSGNRVHEVLLIYTFSSHHVPGFFYLLAIPYLYVKWHPCTDVRLFRQVLRDFWWHRHC